MVMFECYLIIIMAIKINFFGNLLMYMYEKVHEWNYPCLLFWTAICF